MHSRLLLVVITCACLADARPASAQREDAEDPIATTVDGANQFALELYQQLRSKESNLVFAPSSIHAALAMASAGAAGKTEKEITTALHAALPAAELHEQMRFIQNAWAKLDADEALDVKTANRVWAGQGVEFLPDFVNVTREKYGAECTRLPFENTEEARSIINTWVEERTNNQIKELLPRGAISPETRLVLTSAMYFSGRWAQPFAKELTTPDLFHVSADKSVQVPMMRLRGRFRYAAVADAQILELPYGDGRLSMILVLPMEKKLFEAFAARWNWEHVRKAIAALQPESAVEVLLPRFKTRSQVNLNRALRTLGVESAFRPETADFTRMTGGRDLWIATAIHETYVDVDEHGTEAAAATALVGEPTGPPNLGAKIPVVRADRPFLFFIRESQYGAMLYFGQVLNPHPEQMVSP